MFTFDFQTQKKIIITSKKSAPVAAWGEVAWIW